VVDGTLLVGMHGHRGLVGGQGLAQLSNAKQRGAQQHQQGGGKRQGELGGQLHRATSRQCAA
jgi:hypothetical protein